VYCFQETVQWSSPPSTLIIPVCSGCKSFLSFYSEKEDCGQFLCLRIWYRNHSSGVDNFLLSLFLSKQKQKGKANYGVPFEADPFVKIYMWMIASMTLGWTGIGVKLCPILNHLVPDFWILPCNMVQENGLMSTR
jgi:hypothetical protein